MSRKPKYVKLRLEIDMQVSDSLFRVLQSQMALKELAIRNAFHNNPRILRHVHVQEIPEVEYNAK